MGYAPNYGMQVPYAQPPRNSFAAMDMNGDGVVTRQEYAQAQAFNAMDRNGDGVVTRQEFAQAAYPAPAPQPYVPNYGMQVPYAQPPRNSFAAMDMNGVGVVTRQEYAQAQA